MSEHTTADTIINYLKKITEEKLPTPPSVFLDAAMKLTILLSDVDEELISAKCAVAEAKARLIASDMTAVRAKIEVEAMPEYRAYLLAEAKRDRIMAFVQICKKRVELKEWE